MKDSKKERPCGEGGDADCLVLTCSPSSYRELSLADFQGHHVNAEKTAGCYQPIQCRAVISVVLLTC